MGTFRATMASLLRNNPTIYHEPRDAMLFLMVAAGEWRSGQWEVEGVPINNKRMSIEDLFDLSPSDGTERLHQHIQVMQRRLLDANMDTFLDDDPTNVYFRPTYLRDFRTLQLVEGVFPEKAPFLDFPDDIAPDWGQAITHFHAWLDHELTNRHLLNPNIKDHANPKMRAHWPEPALKLHKAIDSARRRLHPLLNDGQSYAAHCKERNSLASRLIGELLKEEKAQSAPARPSP